MVSYWLRPIHLMKVNTLQVRPHWVWMDSNHHTTLDQGLVFMIYFTSAYRADAFTVSPQTHFGKPRFPIYSSARGNSVDADQDVLMTRLPVEPTAYASCEAISSKNHKTNFITSYNFRCLCVLACIYSSRHNRFGNLNF